ncbi:glycosyltransferase family 4 protein [Citricoccus sp.]|uniref:glycosyltransferase family 4 protein n=1 Tax=Citricoccus sp. TaxID=1978372 RepID=UPI0028BD4C16|nr:glycosyltransferase family 4 protein [Citricoccus sp.]
MNFKRVAQQQIRRVGSSLPPSLKTSARRSLDLLPDEVSARVRRAVLPGQARAGEENVNQLLSVPPEFVGSTYGEHEVLPMLALENSVLRRKLTAALDELDTLREVEVQYSGSLSNGPDSEETQGPAPEELADEYLSGQVLRAGAPRHLVIANDYPDIGREYGNGFVHRRLLHYIDSGIDVDVVLTAPSQERRVYTFDGVRVLVGHGPEIAAVLSRQEYRSVSVHFLNALMWRYLVPFLPDLDLHVFLHGYECDRWIRRVFNFGKGTDLERGIDRTLALQRFWRDVVRHPHGPASFIFVSEWWRRAVTDDMGLVFPAARSRIVHNFIDTELFSYVPKDEDQRFKLLWVRNAGSRKYGNDIAVQVLQRLAKGHHWSRIEATIIGDGKYFHEFEDALGHHPNVKIQRRFVSQEDVAALHRDHGIFLVPSRLDSQGVSRDEAMSSGLIPVTNAVTAIPEFVDEDCAILGGDEDVDALVRGLNHVLSHPALFTRMSSAASERAQRQCGADATVRRELELMGLSKPTKGNRHR